ncbi:hypothetical protein [Rhizobium sp. Root1203]|nr:hypothetical protein [Rhizobium sp. Root1203]
MADALPKVLPFSSLSPSMADDPHRAIKAKERQRFRSDQRSTA